jgi:hypothetical protein
MRARHPIGYALLLASVLTTSGPIHARNERAGGGSAGVYRVAAQWPSGIYERLIGMWPGDAPICRAVANALNASALPRPIRVCRHPPIRDAAVSEVTWQALSNDDPADVLKQLFRALHRRSGGDQTMVDQPGWLRPWTEKLANGEARLETATLEGFSSTEPTTRLLRWTENDCASKDVAKAFWSHPMMAVVAGEPIDQVVLVNALGQPESAFVHAGKGYLLGIGYRTDDNRFRPLPKPQQFITVHRLYEGPGSTLPVSVVEICRLIYWERN